MPNPVARGSHILITMEEINELNSLDLICRIAGVSPQSLSQPITAQSIADVINNIQVRKRNEVNNNNSLTDQFTGLSDISTPLRNVANELRDMLHSGYSMHTVNGNTLLIDTEGLEGDQLNEARQFNTNAMLTYHTNIMGQPEPSRLALSQMVNEEINAAKVTRADANRTTRRSNVFLDDIFLDDAFSNDIAFNNDDLFSNDDDLFYDDESSSDDDLYNEDEPEDEIGPAPAPAPEANEPAANINPIILTMDDINNLDNWSLICRVAGVSPQSIEEPLTAPKILNVINRIEERSGDNIIPKHRYTFSLNSSDNIDAVVGPRESVDFYASHLRRCLTLAEDNISLYSGDSKNTVLIDTENLSGDRLAKAKRFNANAIKTYQANIMGQSGLDESEIEQMADDVLNNARRTQPAPEDTNNGIIHFAEFADAAHPRWINEGISKYEIDDLEVEGLSADDKKKKQLQFLSDLTGVTLVQNSTYDDCKRALEKICINGKSAYEHFDMANEAQDMTTIENKVIPGIVKIINKSFQDGKQDFIFIKEPEKDAVPLKLGGPIASASKYPGDVRDRIISIDEAREYIKKDYLSKFLKAGADSKYADKKSREYKDQYDIYNSRFQVLYSAYDYTDEESRANAEYATDLLAKNNGQLLDEYNRYFTPVIEACKKQEDYREQVKNILAEAGIKSPNEKDYDEAEQQVLSNYIKNLPKDLALDNMEASDGQRPKTIVQLNALREEFDKRSTKAAETGMRNERARNNEGTEANSASPNSAAKPYREKPTYNLENDINNLINENLANYNKYQRYNYAEEHNKRYNKMAETYAKKLSNEFVNRVDERMLQYHANSMPPKFSLSLDDLADPASLMKAINEKGISYDNIIIDGKSIQTMLEETAHRVTKKNELTQRDIEIVSRSGTFRKEVFEKFDKMVHPNNYPHRSNELPMPVITLKTAAGEIAPTITSGNELEALPKVEPISGFMRMISRQSTIDANEKEVKEYKASVARMEARHADNLAKGAITEVIRINTKFSSGKTLTQKEWEFAASRNINYPNPAVQNTSLNTLQQMTGSPFPNMHFTQPVNENSNSRRGPQNGMDANN